MTYFQPTSHYLYQCLIQHHNLIYLTDYNIHVFIFNIDVMEYNFQMERSFGCQYISVLNTSDDHELIEAGWGYIRVLVSSSLSTVYC